MAVRMLCTCKAKEVFHILKRAEDESRSTAEVQKSQQPNKTERSFWIQRKVGVVSWEQRFVATYPGCLLIHSVISPLSALLVGEAIASCLMLSTGMLGSSASLLTFDSATRLNFLTPVLATVSPNIALLSANFCGALPSNVVHGAWTSSFPPKKWIIHSTAQIDDLPLSANDKKTWEACREALSTFEFSIEEKDKILGKAFGHVHSPYWGEERKKEVPKLEIVSEILYYLKNLGLSDDDLQKLIKKFPEVVGCSLEHELKTNVKILEKDWGIKGKSLRNLILRNPKVLGYNVDCKGDCMAQCTRCWVRF